MPIEKLSTKQLKYIQFAADPTNHNLSAREIAEKFKVNVKTIYRWRDNPKVQREIETLVRRHSLHSLPYAWKCLKERMPKDTQALKLYFTLIGEYKDAMELSGPGGDAIRLSWLAKKSDEELEGLLDKLED